MSEYEYIDIHSHLNFEQFDTDREAIIARLKEENIATITVGTTVADSKKSIELAEKHDHLFATVGIHPTHDWNDIEFAELNQLAAHPKVVAIGECGLDFFRLPKEATAQSDPELLQQIKFNQGQAFARHIEIALTHNKPLMVHCRAAYEEAITILNAFRTDHALGDRLRGNMHFFAGSPEIAKKYLALGFTLSFDGPITFARDYDEVIKNTPLSSLMSETDAPFAAPVPFRGKRNEPGYVKEVVRSIAAIRGEDLETVKTSLVSTAMRFFALKPKV